MNRETSDLYSSTDPVENDEQLQEALRMSLLEYQQSFLGSSSAGNEEAGTPFHPSRDTVIQSIPSTAARDEDEKGRQAAIQISLSETATNPNADTLFTQSNSLKASTTPLPPSATFENIAEKLQNDDLTEILMGSYSSPKRADDRFVVPSVAKEAIKSRVIAEVLPDSKKQRTRKSVLFCAESSTATSRDRESEDNVAPTYGMSRIKPEALLPILELVFGIQNAQVGAEDILRWFNHSFTFSSNINWGLLQSQGGPCGVLASVQGWIIRSLFFKNAGLSLVSSSPAEENAASFDYAVEEVAPHFSFTYVERVYSLMEAICAILYQCTAASHYRLIFIDAPTFQDCHNASNFSLLNLADAWYAEFDTIQKVLTFLSEQPHLLETPTSVISLVCSVIATRGTDQVKADMDDSTQSMVRMFGHSSQELVNLFLSGKASSNVFDGDITLDTSHQTDSVMTFGGVVKRPAIGFLTELEGLRYMEVGQYFKNPHFPVWVVGSSNHYTTLFSPDIRVSRLSVKELASKDAAKAFAKFDTNGEKIVYANLLEPLLKECGMEDLYREAYHALDIDCGVILFRDFEEWYTHRRLSFSAMKDALPPDRMTLYYYDGQDPPGPSLRCFLVEKTDLEKEFAQSDISDVARVLWTRWPGYIVSTLPIKDARYSSQ